MRYVALFSLLELLAVSLSMFSSVFALDANVTEEIVRNAAADNVDLSSFELRAAINEISGLWDQISQNTTVTYSAYTSGTSSSNGPLSDAPLSTFLAKGRRIDIHTHVVPDWYRKMIPVSAGDSTPAWDLASFISFMDSEQIDRAVFSFSEPCANIHLGNKSATVALARLMNEQAAAYCAAYPDRLKFNAVVPLPYAPEAIAEAQYAINKLGAAGILLTSNFEGTYLGNAQFRTFFQALDSMNGKKVLSIHPGPPYIKYEDQFLIGANPTSYRVDTVEFYFETARALMDLTLSGTLQNFTSINYIVPFAGAAFPATIDRILRSSSIYNSSLEIYKTRFWWDTAGPSFDHQVSGLLSYGIPKSQLLFGTDYPYASPSIRADSLKAMLESTILTGDERAAVFSTNAHNAFAGVGD